MAITVGAAGLRISTTNRAKPNVLGVAMAAPGPIALAASGTGPGGAPLVNLCVAANRKAYWGYSYAPTAAGQQAPDASGAIVEGFAGVEQGNPVYVADNGDLTHSNPAGGGGQAIAEDYGTINATAVRNIIVPFSGVVSQAQLVVGTTVAANDTNFWTVSIINKGQAGAGTAAVLAATDPNTTKATGGAGLTADVARALTLGAAADLVVVEGDVLEMTFTKAAAAPDLVGTQFNLEIGGGSPGEGAIGLGVRSTAIYFFVK